MTKQSPELTCLQKNATTLGLNTLSFDHISANISCFSVCNTYAYEHMELLNI